MKAITHHEKSYIDGPAGIDDPAESSYHPLTPPNAGIWLPCHYFDYVGGSGTGRLHAIMLGRLRMDVHDSILASEAVRKEAYHRKQWLKRWSYFTSLQFCPRPNYNYDGLKVEQMIQKVLLDHALKIPGFPISSGFESDPDQCRTVVVAFRKQEPLGLPFLFRTYSNVHGIAQPSSRALRFDRNLGLRPYILIWELARAMTATPTFPQPININGDEYTGSCFGMNNACDEIYREVELMSDDRHDSIILSIGSGTNNILSRDRKTGFHQSLTRSKSESEQSHQRMTLRGQYYGLDVEEGLGQIKMDEWRARGGFRTSIGSLIGRHRLKYGGKLTSIELEPLRQEDQQLFSANRDHTVDSQTHTEIPANPNQRSAKQAAHQAQGSHNLKVAAKDSPSGPIAVDNKSNISRWFQPKDHTKESICRYTREYLDREDVQSKVNEIAKILVEHRRERVKSDLGRWQKFCLEH